MAVIISEFTIDSFRGTNNLSVDNLNHINLIVGDNNCGKTSVLEALLLLRAPEDLVNIIRTARARDILSVKMPDYDNFINMLSKTSGGCGFGINAQVQGKRVECSVTGEESRILLDHKDMEQRFSRSVIIREDKAGEVSGTSEANAFHGTLRYNTGSGENTVPISINEYSRFSGMMIGKKDLLKIRYLSPFDHVIKNIIDNIIKKDKYKELCIRILQIFDPDIEDLLILRNESAKGIEYIRHKKIGNMPISTYGDGIKKVLSLANAIAAANNGILLIDEVETAIHSKYYNNIFSFLVEACRQFGVQLFITTHSIEAVDGLLATQNYDKQNDKDNISVITLKKAPDKTYSRVLTGRQVADDREAFGFEVRV